MNKNNMGDSLLISVIEKTQHTPPIVDSAPKVSIGEVDPSSLNGSHTGILDHAQVDAQKCKVISL